MGVNMSSLHRRLQSNDPDLQVIDLTGQPLQDAGCQALARSLHHNTVVRKLVLSQTRMGDAGLIALAAGVLKHNTTITTLVLGKNEIGDAGAAALAKALHTNTTVRRVYLYHNQIGCAGTAALAEMLKVNTSLELLTLSENQIGNVGATALANVLQTSNSCPSLQTLDLYQNKITQKGVDAVLKAVQRKGRNKSAPPRTSLKYLKLAGNGTTPQQEYALEVAVRGNRSGSNRQ